MEIKHTQHQKKAAILSYDEIKKGSAYSFDRKITLQDVQDFANLSGDFNPLHTSPEFGKGTSFNGNIVHGMLAASLFSTLIGMHCPGEKALYLQQTLQFKSPIFPGDTVTVKGIVIDKNDSIKMITMKTEILKEGKQMIVGEAKAQVRE
jgi:3-hydroxybutyryl-CoA dehydratase